MSELVPIRESASLVENKACGKFQRNNAAVIAERKIDLDLEGLRGPLRQEKFEMGTGKILVVDDDDNFRIVLAQMLSRLGYEVASADSGEKGLSIFFKNEFDMVLSDYQMPGMDGIALAITIKNNSPHTPVIIMTGFGTDAVFSKNCSAVDELISKPFTLAEIDKTIRRHAANATRSVPYSPLALQPS